jgi:hypothetical protein
MAQPPECDPQLFSRAGSPQASLHFQNDKAGKLPAILVDSEIKYQQ